jgi:hypothetical protein
MHSMNASSRAGEGESNVWLVHSAQSLATVGSTVVIELVSCVEHAITRKPTHSERVAIRGRQHLGSLLAAFVIFLSQRCAAIVAARMPIPALTHYVSGSAQILVSG